MTEPLNISWPAAPLDSEPFAPPANMRVSKRRILDRALVPLTDAYFEGYAKSLSLRARGLMIAAILSFVASGLIPAWKIPLLVAGGVFAMLYWGARNAYRSCQGLGMDECKDEVAELVATSPTAALIDRGLRDLSQHGFPRIFRLRDLHLMRVAAKLDLTFPD